MVGFQGDLGFCSAFACLRCDALPRNLVFYDHNSPHWAPSKCSHRSWVTFHLVKLPFLHSFSETMTNEHIWFSASDLFICLICFSMNFNGWEAMLFFGMNAALR